MKNRRVVVIDDDTWTSEQYQRVLQKEGFIVYTAPNALSGMELIDQIKPCAVVLDMFMPGPNAMVLLHEIRSHEDLSHIPIVITTNHASMSVEDVGHYGVREVLDKATMHPDDIVRAVKRAM